MKRMGLARRNSNASGTSIRPRRGVVSKRRFAVCVRNDGYEASLERNKIYTVLPDRQAERDGDLRVIDESGQDYLFSADRFVRSKYQRGAELHCSPQLTIERRVA